LFEEHEVAVQVHSIYQSILCELVKFRDEGQRFRF